MQLKVSTKKEALNAFPESTFINKSGVYDVTIKFASIDVAPSGAESVNFNVSYNDNEQTFYGPYVTSKSGDVIEVGARLLNNLGVIAGMKEGEVFNTEEESHVVGKDKKSQEFTVITQLSGLPVKMQVQERYSKYNGEIRSGFTIRNFFTEDGASAAELVSGTDKGKQLATVLEKYASNVTYEDGLTAEEVEAWKASKRTNKPSAKVAPKVAAKPSTSLFK